MVNSAKLKDAIRKSGKTKSFLAKKLNISYCGFLNYVDGKADFRISHVQMLCEELGITDLKEKESIFFAKTGA